MHKAKFLLMKNEKLWPTTNADAYACAAWLDRVLVPHASNNDQIQARSVNADIEGKTKKWILVSSLATASCSLVTHRENLVQTICTAYELKHWQFGKAWKSESIGRLDKFERSSNVDKTIHGLCRSQRSLQPHTHTNVRTNFVTRRGEGRPLRN